MQRAVMGSRASLVRVWLLRDFHLGPVDTVPGCRPLSVRFSSAKPVHKQQRIALLSSWGWFNSSNLASKFTVGVGHGYAGQYVVLCRAGGIRFAPVYNTCRFCANMHTA